MGDDLLVESKRSNLTSFMIHMAYEMDVVAQALLLIIVCRSLSSLSSSAADDDCLWEVRASKSWIPYWSPSQT
jgi:hypothetical protein